MQTAIANISQKTSSIFVASSDLGRRVRGGFAEALDYLCASHFRSPCSIPMCCVSRALPAALCSRHRRGEGVSWVAECFAGAVSAVFQAAAVRQGCAWTSPSQQGWKLPLQCLHSSPSPPSTPGTSWCPCASGLDSSMSLLKDRHPAPGVMPHLLTHGKDRLGTGALPVGCWQYWHSQLSMM